VWDGKFHANVDGVVSANVANAAIRLDVESDIYEFVLTKSKFQQWDQGDPTSEQHPQTMKTTRFPSKKTIAFYATARKACLVLAAFAGSGSLLPAREVSPANMPNILFCISDDQSYPHASAYGEPVIKTPVFDRVAREGVLFTQAYCAAPSCTPSRSAILTGQDIWRLGEGGQLFGTLPAEHPVYTDLLARAGYHVG
jgi:hypothetical protein